MAASGEPPGPVQALVELFTFAFYLFLLENESNPGPYSGRKDQVNEKFPMSPSGIEPTTFQLEAQCLMKLYQACDLMLQVIWYL